jgi:DNA mismatch repair ATPase MutS
LLSNENDNNDSNNLEDHDCKIHYFHQIESGVFEMHSGYGILMGELCGLPKEIINRSKQVRNDLDKSHQISLCIDEVNVSNEFFINQLLQLASDLEVNRVINEDLKRRIDERKLISFLRSIEN